VRLVQVLGVGEKLAAPMVDLRERGPGDRRLAARRLDRAGVPL
jgi:hypothetical protein